jgi:cytochrome c oxidase subunit 3
MMTQALNNSSDNKMETKGKIPSSKILLWLGIASIVILFAALTSAYIVREAEGNWVKFELPSLFYFSTACILLSSIFMNMAMVAARKNASKTVQTTLGVTLLLGILFISGQFLGWKALVHEGIFFAGNKSNPSGSFLYVITGLHVAHLVAGILYLIFVFSKSFKNQITDKDLLRLELCATYWHFLGGLWVYLFLFLLFIR